MSKKKSPKPQLNNYKKFYGIAFQMAATIILFLFLGKFLDNYFQNKTPILLAILSIVGVLLSIYNLIMKVK